MSRGVLFNEMAQILEPITARLRNLESQEVLIKAFYRQDSSGNFYISSNADALGLENTITIDFWMDTGNRKLRVRAVNAAELDNRVQFTGIRFVGDGSGDQYTIANTTVQAGDGLASFVAGGAVAGLAGGGTRPDGRESSEIITFPDFLNMPWTSTNTPGLMVFRNVPPNNGGGNFTGANDSLLDSLGRWTMGRHGGSYSNWSDAAEYTARVNLWGNPADAVFPAIKCFHADDPSAGETGQSIVHNFMLRGNSGAGLIWVEAARMHVIKENDFLTAAAQDAMIRFSTISNGSLGTKLSIYSSYIESHVFVLFPAATTGNSSIRLPHGTAPSSPVNGDMWTTTAGLYVYINGATVGPLS